MRECIRPPGGSVASPDCTCYPAVCLVFSGNVSGELGDDGEIYELQLNPERGWVVGWMDVWVGSWGGGACLSKEAVVPEADANVEHGEGGALVRWGCFWSGRSASRVINPLCQHGASSR